MLSNKPATFSHLLLPIVYPPYPSFHPTTPSRCLASWYWHTWPPISTGNPSNYVLITIIQTLYCQLVCPISLISRCWRFQIYSRVSGYLKLELIKPSVDCEGFNSIGCKTNWHAVHPNQTSNNAVFTLPSPTPPTHSPLNLIQLPVGSTKPHLQKVPSVEIGFVWNWLCWLLLKSTSNCGGSNILFA